MGKKGLHAETYWSQMDGSLDEQTSERARFGFSKYLEILLARRASKIGVLQILLARSFCSSSERAIISSTRSHALSSMGVSLRRSVA